MSDHAGQPGTGNHWGDGCEPKAVRDKYDREHNQWGPAMARHPEWRSEADAGKKVAA